MDLTAVQTELKTAGSSWIADHILSTGKDKIISIIYTKTGIDLNKIPELSNIDMQTILKLEKDKNILTDLKNGWYQAVSSEFGIPLSDVASISAKLKAQLLTDDKLQKWWRPLFGYATLIAFLFLSISVCIFVVSTIFIKDPIRLKELNTTLSAIIGLMANPSYWMLPTAVLGISAWTRGQEKTKRMDLLVKTDPTQASTQQPAVRYTNKK